MNLPPNAVCKPTDAELLMRFVRAKDEACFEAIVARHSKLVFQVCNTVLMNHADAEDAFQATFVVLVRKANCLLRVNSLAAWLYKVAYRIAVRANQSKKRKSHSSLQSEPEAEIDQFHMISKKEVLSGVFDELARLPMKYKEVLVECYLQGKSYREVAESTDSTEAAVKGRLAQAKKTLRQRLLKRGLALSFVLVMLEQVRSVSVASSLVHATTTSSLSTFIGESGAKIPAAVQSLTKLGVKKMSMQLLTKPMSIALLVLVTAMVPISWAFSQPVGGQDAAGGLTVKQAAAEKNQGADNRKLSNKEFRDPFGKRKTNDPFGAGKPNNPFGGGDAANPFYGPNNPRVSSAKSKSTAPTKAGSKAKALSPVEAEARIDKSLLANADFDFVETPLRDVADEVSLMHGINVHIDKVAIEDAGFDIEMPMTGRGNQRSLRSALRFLFKESEIEFVVKNETLIITTPDAIRSKPDDYLVSRMYDVTDLANGKSDSLIQAIEKNVAVDSWGESGYASLSELNVANKTILVVSHTSEKHVEIQTLLKNLRELGK